MRRIVHAALGAAPSLYQRSKAAGEAVLTGSGLDDHFAAQCGLWRRRPVAEPFCETAKRIPGDATGWGLTPGFNLCGWKMWRRHWLTSCCAKTSSEVENNSALRNIYEACGPNIYTLKELVQLAGTLVWPLQASHRIARSAGQSAGPVHGNGAGPTSMSRDNLDSMKVDNGQRPAARPAGAGHSARVAVSYCAVVSGTRPR